MLSAPCHSLSRKKLVPPAKSKRSAKRGVRNRTASAEPAPRRPPKQQPQRPAAAGSATRRRATRRRARRAARAESALAEGGDRGGERDDGHCGAQDPRPHRDAAGMRSVTPESDAEQRERCGERDGAIQNQRQVVRRAVESRDPAHPLHIHTALPRDELPEPCQARDGCTGEQAGDQQQATRAAGRSPDGTA